MSPHGEGPNFGGRITPDDAAYIERCMKERAEQESRAPGKIRYVRFAVHGKSQTAGSKRGFPYQGRDGRLHVRMPDDNPKSEGWKDRVGWVAKQALGRAPMLEGPLVAWFRFYRSRPKGHTKPNGDLSAVGRREFAPGTRPDVLKLARAAEDAMIGIVYRDDAQIVSEVITKRWSEHGKGDGVTVVVCEHDPSLILEQVALFSELEIIEHQAPPLGTG